MYSRNGSDTELSIFVDIAGVEFEIVTCKFETPDQAAAFFVDNAGAGCFPTSICDSEGNVL